MRARVVLLCLLVSAATLSVKGKPHGKHHALSKSSHTAKEKDVIPEEANEGQVLPTFVTFEASSQEQEDEDMTSEDNANTNADKEDGVFEATERGEKSTPVLLSEEELVDLLKEESNEEEAEDEEEEEEEEEEEKEEQEMEAEEAVEIIDEGEEDKEEEEEEEEEEREVEEDLQKEEKDKEVAGVEEVKEESDVEAEKEEKDDEAGEEMSVEGKEEDGVGVTGSTGAQEGEETDGSAEAELPVDLDYAGDSDVSQPLQTESAKVKPHADDDAQLLSKDEEDSDVTEKEEPTGEKEIPTETDDYEQDVQNTEAAESEETEQDELREEDKDQGKGSQAQSQDKSDSEKEAKAGADLQVLEGALVAGTEDGEEEEEGKDDSVSHTKRKTRKQKKNQRVRKHPPQSDEPLPGLGLGPQAPQVSGGRPVDNTVLKAKRRRAGKWAPSVGMNPVQIRATVDLYPSARPPRGGSILRPEAPADPCDSFRCKRGKSCKLNEDNKPACVCQEPSQCPPSVNKFDHVCGTDNNTYDTSCELFATKCNLEGTKRGHRLHLDYTGPCKFIAPCQDTELIQFPLRMRDWLKNVLLQLYEHDTMSPGFLTPKQRVRVRKIFESERRLHAGDHPIELLALDFEKNYNMYIYPVHWQFAQMDQHPADRFLTHSELAPLRVPLVPMEHCTSRFFQECDADKDKLVSFREWAQCFGIKEEDMDVSLLF